MKAATILLLAILYATGLYADGFKLYSHHVTTDNGLPGNTIYDIVQDANGYVWMATDNGLSRYDGYSTVNYTSLAYDSRQRLQARIGRLFMDARNNLIWISTATYQNACYDLRRALFTDWTGKGDCYRPMNKLMLTRHGTVFYGEGLGARVSIRQADGGFTSSDYNKKSGTLPDDNIVSVVEDSAGNIWLPTKNGIAVIAENRAVTVEPHVSIIAAAAGEEAYFLSKDGEVFVFKNKKRTRKYVLPEQLGHPVKVNTSFLWQGRWMLFTPQGTYAMDLKTGSFTKPAEWQVTDGLNQGTCEGYHFIGTREGRLWIFPDHGKAKSLDLIPNARHTTNKGWLFHTVRDRQGRLFIATYGAGLYVYDNRSGSLSHYSANDASPIIASDYLLTAMTDQQGCIWIGTEMAGAYCLTVVDNKTVNMVKPNPATRGDRNNTVSSLCQRQDGGLLMGIRNGSIYTVSGTGPAQVTLAMSDKKEVDVTAQLTDSHGGKWTGTWGKGLYRDGTLYSTKEPGHNIASDFISDIVEDGAGNIWIATWNGGIIRVEGDSIRQVMTGNMNANRVSDIDIAADGTLWAATNDGICQIAKDGKITMYNTSNGLFSNDEINAVLFDKPNTLWVATAGSGAIKCEIAKDGQLLTVESYSKDNGLAGNNATALVKDKGGNVWVGTENGMSRIVAHANITDTYRFAETTQGNSISKKCAMATADGHLYVGTGDGLLVFNPQAFNTADKRRLDITNVSINGEAHLAERPATLSHGQNNMTFFFSCFEYSSQQKPVFQYYLEGLEREWQNTTDMNEAVYRNLAPGHYTFHVRTTNTGGKWQQDITYTFTINQPWYNTWWAWTVYMLIIAMTCWYVYRNWRERFRLHQQMKMERQLAEYRMNLFTDITHEFRTPLAIIKGAIDKLQQDATSKAAQQTMQRAAKRMMRMVNQFLEFRKTSSGNLRLQVEQGDIVVFIRDIVQDLWVMSKQKDQQLTFTPFAKHHDMPFDRHLVESIAYNLLSNAIKYTPERGNISVTLRQEGESIRLCVEDNGPGISERQQAELFKPFVHGHVSHGGMGIGLYTAYQMAVTHKGSLTYQRVSKDGGSRFTLLLPLNADAYAPEDYLDDKAHAFRQETEDSEEGKSMIQELRGEALNSHRVVVIEDDPDIMQQICSEIGAYFNTTGYATGEAGYDSIASNPPSLLVCDVMLPDVTGYEIVERMKRDSKTAAIPVIMLTALDDEAHQIRAYKAGADDYMVKPCNFNLLIARAMQLIKWHTAMAAVTDGNNAEDHQDKATAEGKMIESHIDKVFLEKLEILTAQHLGETTLNVDRLAEMMNMGRTKFFGRVKELTDMSPNKYIQDQRMKKAAELLLEGELSVSEICYKVGFQDPSYFNKVFKAHYGVVPSKYGR